MTSRALGLIEVKGYLGAVVAADAAVKAANVSLLNIETVKAGLNTVQLVGDVSAVRSAVDAAVAAVQHEPYYLTSHVIARLDQQTDLLFEKRRKEVGSLAPSPDQETMVEHEKLDIPKESHVSETVDQEVSEEPSQNASSKYIEAELEKLKVVQLRSLAYQEETVRLSKKEIKFANKRLLIDVLMEIKGKE